MEFLGIVPARGGSKGVPQKNIAHLAGKPLLAYTAEAAKKSKGLSYVILSTDNEEIAALGKKFGLDVPFLRPSSLAADDTPIIDVVRHALVELKKTGTVPDAIVLLQPTSPLRTAKHIDEAIRLFQSPNTDTVVSVTEVPHQFSPGSLMHSKGEYVEKEEANIVLRRQDKTVAFARNGPAILIVSKAVIETGSLYGSQIRPYVMEARDSVDIDTPTDLAYAAFLLEHKDGVSALE